MDDLQTKERDRKKRYLKRYKKNLALIERLEKKLIDLNERIYKVKSSNFSAMPKGGKPVTLVDLVADKDEVETRIARFREKGTKLKTETLEIIDSLDDVRYAEILESFLIDCKSFEEISEEMGYAVRHIERLYTEAIDNVSLECR